MKKVISLILTIVFIIGLVGCGNNLKIEKQNETKLFTDDGLLCVQNSDGFWMFIDNNGKEVLKTDYTVVADTVNEPFKKFGVAIFKNDNKCAILNAKGEELAVFENNNGEKYKIWGFNETDVSIISKDNGSKMQYGIIDTKGKMVYDFSDIWIHSFSKSGYSTFEDANHKYGIIDKTGTIIVKAEYDDKDDLPSFSMNGLAAKKDVNENGISAWGYINTKLEWVIEPQLNSGLNFQDNGLVKVKLDDGYGIMDENGKVITTQTFDSINDYENGVAVVYSNQTCGLINEKGKLIAEDYQKIDIINSQFAKVKKDDKYGYIYLDGKKYLDCNFDELGIVGENGLVAAKQDGQWGYVNKGGKFVIEPSFSKAEPFKANGYAVVSKNGSVGLIDDKGQVKIDIEYKGVKNYNANGIAAVKIDRYWKFIDKDGVEVGVSQGEGLRQYLGDCYYLDAVGPGATNYSIIKDGKVIIANLKNLVFNPNKIN